MSILNTTNWRFIDQTKLDKSFSALDSFAIDDTLCAIVGERHSLPTIRTWLHDRTIVLGIQDSRLPNIEAGMQFLKEKHFNVIVRNSGGLAVVLDKGILNISLIMKENRQISINSGYEMMVELIQLMFAEEKVKIKPGEIIGSYCPGTFDLSIDGKKFAGISQRRVRSGVAVQIYLCVKGSGGDRAGLIKEFYKIAVNGQETKFKYPHISPETMASLEELLQKQLSTNDVMNQLLRVLKINKDTSMIDSQLNSEEEQLYKQNLERITKRQI